MLRRLSVIYALCDFIASALAWALFCYTRNKNLGLDDPLTPLISNWFLVSALVIAFSWTIIFGLTGFYSVSYKRSRLAELVYSLLLSIPGVFIEFFVILSYGFISDNTKYLYYLELLFILQFTLTYFPRLIITSNTAGKVHSGKLGYRTAIIGSNGKASDILRKIREEKIPSGNILTGYIGIREDENSLLAGELPFLGTISEMTSIVTKHNIEEVIIAIEDDEHSLLGEITGSLEFMEITIKAIPSLRDILTGRVEQSAIFGTPLLEITGKPMPVWQTALKSIGDYLLAFLLLIVLSPLMAIAAIIIRSSGKGSIIYSQQRIGKAGKPFTMYKFRSMIPEAEEGQPLLSSKDDGRVTPFGRFMRKHRIDELPNLFNVLKGEMSIVGPRPEREFFINQIVQKAPHYRRLLKVKPGITSWGQVKYGYASDVGQMIERLEFDLLYLENMSLLIDLKILIYTFIIIIKGKGV